MIASADGRVAVRGPLGRPRPPGRPRAAARAAHRGRRDPRRHRDAARRALRQPARRRPARAPRRRRPRARADRRDDLAPPRPARRHPAAGRADGARAGLHRGRRARCPARARWVAVAALRARPADDAARSSSTCAPSAARAPSCARAARRCCASWSPRTASTTSMLTLAPMLVAGDAPTPLRGAALDPPARLALRDVHRADDHLFLHYDRCDATPAPARPHRRRSQPGRPLIMGIVNAGAGLVLRRRAPATRSTRQVRARARARRRGRRPRSTSAASRASPTRRRAAADERDRARRPARRARSRPRACASRSTPGSRAVARGGARRRARRCSTTSAGCATRRWPTLARAHRRGARRHAHARRAQAARRFADYDDDVVGDVEAFLRERIALARDARRRRRAARRSTPGPTSPRRRRETRRGAARARPRCTRSGARCCWRSRASTSSARSPGAPPAERLAGTLAAVGVGGRRRARRSCASTTSPPSRDALARQARARGARRGPGVRRRATSELKWIRADR